VQLRRLHGAALEGTGSQVPRGKQLICERYGQGRVRRQCCGQGEGWRADAQELGRQWPGGGWFGAVPGPVWVGVACDGAAFDGAGLWAFFNPIIVLEQ